MVKCCYNCSHQEVCVHCFLSCSLCEKKCDSIDFNDDAISCAYWQESHQIDKDLSFRFNIAKLTDVFKFKLVGMKNYLLDGGNDVEKIIDMIHDLDLLVWKSQIKSNKIK